MVKKSRRSDEIFDPRRESSLDHEGAASNQAAMRAFLTSVHSRKPF